MSCSDAHDIRSDPDLEADGWVRRFVADPVRAREAVEIYTASGFDVRVQPLTPERFGPGCDACAQVACATWSIVYTRHPTAGLRS